MLHAQQDGHSKDKTDIETRNGCDVEQLGGQPFPPRDSHKTEWCKWCDLGRSEKRKSKSIREISRIDVESPKVHRNGSAACTEVPYRAISSVTRELKRKHRTTLIRKVVAENP